ncbi:MAG: hypothetical protein GY817_01305 [bacterium]|nr:hypothetical protein [bacterium]
MKKIFLLVFMFSFCLLGCQILIDRAMDDVMSPVISNQKTLANIELKIYGTNSKILLEYDKIVNKDKTEGITNIPIEPAFEKIDISLPYSKIFELYYKDELHFRITPKKLEDKIRVEVWEDDILKKTYILTNIMPLRIRWNLDTSKIY